MDTRSGSSSPDPLGYPGDPEYLLSSAKKKPFNRVLNSSASPQKQPPRRRGRPSLRDRQSPTKSPSKTNTHSIKYEDIILPSTPSGAARFERRSLSPTKTTLQSDGNISPWRIRVTVEAERDEDGEEIGENPLNGIGAALWSTGGKTKKVPLKGGASSTEPTPKKRRQRKSKAELTGRTPTPRRKRSIGSAEKGGLDSVEPKKKPKALKSEHSLHDIEAAFAKRSGPTHSQEDFTYQKIDPFLDIAQDEGIHHDSNDDGPDIVPIESVGDFNDEVPHVDPIESVGYFNEDDLGTSPVESAGGDVDFGGNPEATNSNVNYPNISRTGYLEAPLDRRKELAHPEILPGGQKITSFSPINTTHAGYTPRAKRVYPTPTSSSLLEDEMQEKPIRYHTEVETIPTKKGPSIEVNNPAEEHREYDSILESEGFSMVSLDTLPSARQQLRNILEKHQTERSEPVFQGLLMEPPLRPPNKSSKNQIQSSLQDVSLQPKSSPALEQKMKPQHRTPPSTLTTIRSPPPAPFPVAKPLKRRPLARLARVVRAGIALQGVLDRGREGGSLGSLSTTDSQNTDDVEATRQRLDYLFQDLSAEIQRELRAGLRFGEELVKRLRQSGQKQPEGMLPREAINRTQLGELANSGDKIAYPEIAGLSDRIGSPIVSNARGEDLTNLQEPPRRDIPGNRAQNLVDSMMVEREAEWQREREMISRQIEMANESQVIVIDSDSEQPPAANSATHKDEIEPPSDEDVDMAEQEVNNDDDELEDDYFGDITDIWQQEARDGRAQSKSQSQSQSQSPSFTDLIHEALPISPLNREIRVEEEDVDYAMSDDEIIPLENLTSRTDGFPQLAVGKTKTAKYRDADASLSSLVATPESATRRFYEGTSGDVGTAVQRQKHQDITSSPPQTTLRTRARQIIEWLPDLSPRQIPMAAMQQVRVGGRGVTIAESDEEHIVDEGVVNDDYEYKEEVEAETPDFLENQPARSVSYSPVAREEEEPDRHGSISNAMETSVQSVAVSQEVTDEQGHEDYSDSENNSDNLTSISVADIPEPTSTRWFSKITGSLAPAWLTSTPRATTTKRTKPDDRPINVPVTSTSQSQPRSQSQAPSQSQSQRKQPQKSHIHPSSRNNVTRDTYPTVTTTTHHKNNKAQLQPLSISGYFTDDHYVLLRQIYREAQAKPEQFTYKATLDREAMIGQSMWSADRQHTRKVTEIQLMIVDRFRKELIRDDIRRGSGEGEMEWTEEDILWRLFSIIVGEQIRRERKEKQRQEELQV
ncbi:hypothetical protein FQN57_002976 [Myotisia sp. PD_48]|nr:hypothetical protein FQN57_002976 [Myotisia sp. PD_48]